MMQGSRLQLSEKMCSNVYYMLCYAPDELQYMEVGDIHFENVKGVDDLLAALICNSLDIWDRNKILREYKIEEIKSDRIKGRIDFVKSYYSGAIADGRLVCRYHRLNVDTPPNRIIKFALKCMMMQNKNISKPYIDKISIRYNEMTAVQDIDIDDYVAMHKSFYDIPIHYRPILSASKIAIENILANTADKENYQLTELFKLEDDRRYQYIFEKFVRNLYRQTFESLGVTVSKPVYRQYNTHGEVEDDTEVSGWNNPDIVIKYREKAIVIDTKWYTKKQNIVGNKHEVSDYVTDCAFEDEELTEIHGIVLYAKDPYNTIEDKAYNKEKVQARGYIRRVYQSVINMDDDFETIKSNLIKVVTNVFGEEILKNEV